MKKLFCILCMILIANTSYGNTYPTVSSSMMMSAAAMATAVSASSEAQKIANTVGIGVLAGKIIENCMILNAYTNDSGIHVVCLNKFKDEVYVVNVTKPKGAFSQGVFDELRKSFDKEGKND